MGKSRRPAGNSLGEMESTEPYLIQIEAHADVQCPWCYVQKRSLEVAMGRVQARHPSVEFEVYWRPYYLHAHIKGGQDKKTLIKQTVGPSLPKLIATAAEYGINFSFTGTTGHSRSSHILLALTLHHLGASAQEQVLEELFRGHCCEGRDVSDESWLVDVGLRAGLSEVIMCKEFDSYAARKGVDGAAKEAKESDGIKAVPSITIQGKYRVGGYQEHSVFEKVLEKLCKEHEKRCS